MSTTVTYKGNTLATVSNNTKTLKTAGKYMEGDIQLTDTTSTIVVSETYDTNGGIIKTIATTGEVNLQVKTINPTTSTQTINPDTGYDGFSQVIVGAGSGSINNQNKTVTPTKSQQQITADSGYSGLGTVTVNAIPSQYIEPSGNLAISTNGTGIDVTQYATVSVNVPTGGGTEINNQNKTVTPTESQQSITADSGYTGLGTVTVNAIDSTYVGSGITRRGSTDLTASGATVTIPAGYYSEQTTKSVSSGSATGPTNLSGSSASVSTGTNTLTLTKTGVTTTPTVSEGYVSSATASTATVSLTASVTTKAAATITPTTTNQTIAAGTYLTGAQTIAGDADLVGGNILSTANIFGVQGTVVVQNYYTGSSAPSSSLGQNGDIYIQQ